MSHLRKIKQPPSSNLNKRPYCPVEKVSRAVWGDQVRQLQNSLEPQDAAWGLQTGNAGLAWESLLEMKSPGPIAASQNQKVNQNLDKVSRRCPCTELSKPDTSTVAGSRATLTGVRV